MIKTETEYRLTKQRIDQSREANIKMREQLIAEGLTVEEIERVMEPTLAFQAQFIEEVEWYERVRAGDLSPIRNLNQLGQILIGLRIASGLTQKELAERLEVSESLVSRDEKNDYHGISVERAQRILDALGGQATVVVVPAAKSEQKELAAV
jgi:DNA-binding XRE family transcriptional regulator